MNQELQVFLQDWSADTLGVKPVFDACYAALAALPGVTLEFKGRPGVSYSLRAKHTAQSNRPLFVLVDVIDDAPAARWLSVCFYANLVTDPQERGDVVPGGLMGEDACCFDVEGPEAGDYLLARLQEAYLAAAKG
ncbi:hypothetical protein [Desulfovibrio cuneatus]|uniref:hypothetical protein n=1 Tax=Desulfovibrio cuneatus TaxID=159728 RepID=UPI00040115AB|nr:hypothetical protein [Desulfovibrio cuneatus]